MQNSTNPGVAFVPATAVPQAHPYYYQTVADRPMGEFGSSSDWYSFKNGRGALTPSNYNMNNISTNAPEILRGEYPQNANFRYYGYAGRDRYTQLMCNESIKWMQGMVTKFLAGINPDGKKIIVSEEQIRSTADSVFQTSFANAEQMQKMTVSLIVRAIKDEYETLAKNSKLSIWVTKYDTESGLKQFDDVKLNNKQRSHYSYVKY
jgi:hypothetical protein